MKMVKIVSILLLIAFLSPPVWATFVDLTEDGLGLEKGNYGILLVVNDLLQISALTGIDQPYGPFDGTVYLDRDDRGLGLQTLFGHGSKGISGGGPDADEALYLNFVDEVYASSVVVGLNEYRENDDDPIITLFLVGGGELAFTRSHQNWNSAVTSLGGKKVAINLGKLVGQGFSGLVNSVSVTETAGHIYLNSIQYENIPEPATIALLGLGSLVLFNSKKRRHTNRSLRKGSGLGRRILS